MLHPEVWRKFVGLQRTLGADRTDYPEWHRGRRRYHVWAIDATTPAILTRLEQRRARLREYLVGPYPRQAHITVAVVGFLNDPQLHEDDVSPQTVDRQQADIRALELAPFTVHVGGGNSFGSAAFLEVADPGGALARMRKVLAVAEHEFRDTPYVPHVTVGIYNGAHDVAELQQALNPEAGDELLPLTVAALGLYSYDSRHIGSPLRLERHLPLTQAGTPPP